MAEKRRHDDRRVVPAPSVALRMHKRFLPLDPPGTNPRKYCCADCGAVGTLVDLSRENTCEPTSKSRVKRLAKQQESRKVAKKRVRVTKSGEPKR